MSKGSNIRDQASWPSLMTRPVEHRRGHAAKDKDFVASFFMRKRTGVLEPVPGDKPRLLRGVLFEPGVPLLAGDDEL